MDYTTVTEAPGNRVTEEALAMIYTRYAFAASLCKGKTVLEVACGAGQGLGLLGTQASKLIAGDYTDRLLRTAANHYNGRFPLVRLNAEGLPFRDRSFDLVILYEAIYYLKRPDLFIEECRRLLRDRGIVIICTANRELLDFVPSPLSTRYFSAPELFALLDRRGFDVELYGAFPGNGGSLKERGISLLKRMAATLHLIPKTMRGRETLKSLFYGRLLPVPLEVQEGLAQQYPIAPIRNDSLNATYKVLYAVAHVR